MFEQQSGFRPMFFFSALALFLALLGIAVWMSSYFAPHNTFSSYRQMTDAERRELELQAVLQRGTSVSGKETESPAEKALILKKGTSVSGKETITVSQKADLLNAMSAH